MQVHGLFKRFSTANNSQYEEIAKFWDIVERYVNCRGLYGYGTDWTDEDFLYGIIFQDVIIPKNCIDAVMAEFPDTQLLNDFNIPRSYDYQWCGPTKDLQSLYSQIWNNGTVKHELERFDNDGYCHINIIYEKE